MYTSVTKTVLTPNPQALRSSRQPSTARPPDVAITGSRPTTTAGTHSFSRHVDDTKPQEMPVRCAGPQPDGGPQVPAPQRVELHRRSARRSADSSAAPAADTTVALNSVADARILSLAPHEVVTFWTTSPKYWNPATHRPLVCGSTPRCTEQIYSLALLDISVILHCIIKFAQIFKENLRNIK